MRIETERLIIREFEQRDAGALIDMASDGTLSDVFGDCSRCGEWMGGWIEEACDLTAQDDPEKEYLAYAVVEKETGLLIGSVGCSRYDDLDETGITYFVGSRFRGNGYAAEAARAYAACFLERYKTERLIATIRQENAASWKAIERAGFALKEVRRYRDINDAREEEYRFYTLERIACGMSL